MTARHKPATPLPFRIAAVSPARHPSYPIAASIEGRTVEVGRVYIAARGGSDKDAAYIAHACNAYPKLVDALQDMAAYQRLVGGPENSKFKHVQTLLRELGEAE